MARKLVALLSLLAVLGGVACSKDPNSNTSPRREPVARASVESISSDAAAEFGKVIKNIQGSNGAPIIVIEENHASRATQIQEALILNRLYSRHKINHIVLEGYLKEDSALKTDWYGKSASNSSSAKHSVAVRLLQEGEINSAEFMKLIYDDAVILPAEIQLDYDPKSHEYRDVIRACIGYLYAVALTSLRPEHEAKLAEFEQAMASLEGDEEAMERVRIAASKYLLSKDPSKLSADPWVKEANDRLKKPEVVVQMSIEEEIAFYEEFQKRAPKTSKIVTPQQEEALDGFVTFLKQRSAASKTMVDSTVAVADNPEVYGVAVIIGYGHTKRVVDLLTSANRPFAVIRPDVLDYEKDTSTIPDELYRRKMQGLSLYSEGLNKKLQDAVDAANIKPKPVIQRQWFEAKAELYLYTERISERVLGGGSPPSGGGPNQAPFGFADDDFKGKLVSIDPQQIKIVADDEHSGRQAVLFPVVINPEDSVRRTTLWVKAGRVTDDVPPAAEREQVEKLLKDALDELGGGKRADDGGRTANKGKKPDTLMIGKKPRTAVEDVAGRVKITSKTVAAFGITEKAAMKVVVGRL